MADKKTAKPKKTSKKAAKKAPKVEEVKEEENKDGIGLLSDPRGPVTAGYAMHFHPHDLARLELHQLRIQRLQAETEAKQKEVQLIAFRNAEATRIAKEAQDTLFKEMSLTKNELVRLKRDYDRFRENIEKVYKVDFNTLTYDDVSGKLFFN